MGFLDSIFRPDIRKLENNRDSEGLIRALQHPDLLCYAAEALGRMRCTAAVEPLVHLLDTPNFRHRTCIIAALGEIGDTRAAGPLLSCMISSTNLDDHIVPALRAIGNTGALEKAVSLKKGRDESAVNDLISVLHTSHARGDASMKIDALEKLASIGGGRALEAIRELTTFPDAAVRDKASRLVGQLENTRKIETIQELSHGETGKAVEELCAALKDPGQDVQLTAVEALEKLNHPASVVPLIYTARKANRKKNARVHNAATGALKRMTLPPTFEILFLMHLLRLEEGHPKFIPLCTSYIRRRVISDLHEKAEKMMEETQRSGEERQEFVQAGSLLFDIHTLPTSIAGAAGWFQAHHGGYLACLEEGLASHNFQNWNCSVLCTLVFGFTPDEGKWVHLGIFPAKDSAPTHHMLWPIEFMTPQERRTVQP